MPRTLLTLGAATILVVQTLAACGPAAGPQAGQPVQTPASPVLPVSTAKVTVDTITTTASYGGSIQPVSQVSIVPRTSGRIVNLPVDVGSEVKAGDLLAELDHTTLDAQVAQARANVASAQANLAAAQARLATVMAGPKPEDVAVAQAQLDAAKIRLAQVQAGGRPEDVRMAEDAVAQAQSRLESAQAGGRPEDIVAAQAQLDSAKNRLEQVKAAGRPEDVKAAESALASAKARLAALQNPRPEDLAAAQAAVDQAKTKLAQLQDQPRTANPNDIANAQLAVQQAQVAYDKALADYANIGKSGGPATRAAADAAAQQALIQLQVAQNNLNKLQSQGPTDWDIRQAQEAVNAAQANLDKLLHPSPADLAAAQAAVDQAQTNLDKLKNVTPFDIENAEEAVKQAQANLDKIRNPDPATVAQLQAALDSAQAALEKTKNPSQFDVDAAQAAVAQAQANLDKVKNPYTDQDRQAAQAAVAQAQAALEQQQAALAIQQANLNDSFITAPFDGVISDRQVSQGAIVTTNTPIMTLISKQVEIVLNVEEANIAKFQQNAPATFTVTAFPGEQFTGVITSIFPSGDTRSRTFTVKVRPDEQDGRLRPGMFAQLSVLLERHENVPVVPKDAIVQKNNQPTVFTVADNTATQRLVELGLSDDKRVEIKSGLQPGEDVVISGQATLRDKDRVRVVPPGGAAGGGAGGAPGAPGNQAARSGGASQSGQPGAAGGAGAQRPAGPG